MDVGLDRDERLRLAALRYVEELRCRWDDHVPARELRGFRYEGQPVLLAGPGMGIFKPRQLGDGPISVRTSLESRYEDEPLEDGSVLRYAYAPRAREYDNEGLKRLGRLARPLIYLIQVAPRSQGSEFAIVAPVYVAGWDDDARTFRIELQPARALQAETTSDRIVGSTETVERAYRVVELKSRLHQAHFRRIVLRAYRQRCSVCELRVRPLLDAAHIVPDSEGGEPTVQNGLGMCVLHHRAFDRRILRVTPELGVRIDRARIRAGDGAAVRALLAFDGRQIVLPGDRSLWPSREALEHSQAS